MDGFITWSGSDGYWVIGSMQTWRSLKCVYVSLCLIPLPQEYEGGKGNAIVWLHRFINVYLRKKDKRKLFENYMYTTGQRAKEKCSFYFTSRKRKASHWEVLTTPYVPNFYFKIRKLWPKAVTAYTFRKKSNPNSLFWTSSVQSFSLDFSLWTELLT